jgi:molecular chaperone GrpE
MGKSLESYTAAGPPETRGGSSGRKAEPEAAGAVEGSAHEDAREGAAETSSADEIQTLQRERDQYYDQLLRKAAEFDNYRKRVERERREQVQHAAADLIGELLGVVDDLERALGADPSDEGVDAYRRGVEMIHAKLLDVLSRRGVRPIQAVGEPFDPHMHEAVTYEPSPGRREGEVVEELQRGYTLGNRLLRPAMVKVAKG